MNDSSSFRRFDRRLILVSELVAAMSSRTLTTSACRSRLFSSSCTASAHARVELVAVLLDRVEVHLVGEQLAALHRGHARVDDHERLEVQHALDLAQRHVEHQADAAGQRLEEPDVRRGAGELDVAHALAAHLGLRDLDAALLADHAGA